MSYAKKTMEQMTDATSERLDKALVLRALASSRARAAELIKGGKVLVDGVVTVNQDTHVKKGNLIELSGPDIPWVSRAGSKLEAALTRWHIDVSGKVCLDIGASTGGFTDVLMVNGARKVYALDVGHGQLADKLRQNSKVFNMEGIHINSTVAADFDEPIEVIVIDVSFISLTKVLTKAFELLSPGGLLVALIKPQFEVGKKDIGKGIVTDPKLQHKTCIEIERFAKELGLVTDGIIPSPIEGGDGNKEFLLFAKKSKE